MSHSTQTDSEIIPSVVQPRAPRYSLADPLPGHLTLGLKTRAGSYSDVYRGTWTYNDEEHVVCIKCLRNNPPTPDPTAPDLTPAERFKRRIQREILVQSAHPNVSPFLGYQIIEGQPWLVSPWMDNGSLPKYLESHPDLSDLDKLRFLLQAAHGLAYLHDSVPPIAHGDLKPENILITDELTAALCDMGASRLILDGHTGLTTSSSAPGSAGFQAKELIMGEFPTTKSDIYAMAGVILETLSGKKPHYRARTNGMVILWITTDKMCKPEDHPRLPENNPLWPFLRRCWDPEPEARPTAIQVIHELEEEIERRGGSIPISDNPEPPKARQGTASPNKGKARGGEDEQGGRRNVLPELPVQPVSAPTGASQQAYGPSRPKETGRQDLGDPLAPKESTPVVDSFVADPGPPRAPKADIDSALLMKLELEDKEAEARLAEAELLLAENRIVLAETRLKVETARRAVVAQKLIMARAGVSPTI
ncbi:hypothetical protein M407DRAFT_22183 [Tulasnella calospora MUT 4182]|uniref:Protein kinase domain-containing protein n=1 Tax=Tulasnella calospora MUT 4182 TaxID=1051891 RepID=A0A0C3QNE8_9AGAM|nr:hypothetical protein M407DRAFT_22183 [Tulasnella calospora MUT 4182]